MDIVPISVVDIIAFNSILFISYVKLTNKGVNKFEMSLITPQASKKIDLCDLVT